MSKQFHETPDGKVFIRVSPPDAASTKNYGDTRANFQTDFNVTLAALPAGTDERVYTPGIRHALMGGVGVSRTITGGGPMPFAFGDTAIANIDAGLTAKTARETATAPPHP